MKRDIAEEEREPSRHTSTLTKRLARTDEDAEVAADRLRRAPAAGGRPVAVPAGGAEPRRGGHGASGGRPAPAVRRPAGAGRPNPPAEVRPPPRRADKTPTAGNGEPTPATASSAPPTSPRTRA